MQAPKVKATLETATNFAVILLTMGVLCLASWDYFSNTNTPELKNGLQRGNFISQAEQNGFLQSPKTLFVVLNTNCQPCTESIPFYKRLIDAQITSTSNISQIVAVFPNTEFEVNQYLQQNDLSIKAIHSVNLQSLGVNRTPTVITTNNVGKISNFWIGVLERDSEEQLLMAVSKEKK